MAISKILNMKDCGGHFHGKHLKRALDYVMNPDKTQDGRLVGAINCQVDTAFEQMKETKRNFGKIDKRQGYHIILSFKENEVNPDTAFEITQKFVEEYLGKSYEAVFVVHDNTAHVHSHIVFNSVSFVDGKKYRYEKGDWAKYIQPITNRLCQEYGLSIIDVDDEKKERQHESYKEWSEYREGNFVWSDMIKRDLDACILQAKDYEEFLELLSEKGYQIKQGKHLAIKPQGMTRFRRCKSLGDMYCEEAIRDRIVKEDIAFYKSKQDIPKVSIVKCRVKRYRRAGLSGLQKKHYAKLYRVGKLKKRPYSQVWKYREDIRKMHKLQEQYLFLARHNIHSAEELVGTIASLTDKKKETSAEKSRIYKARERSMELFTAADEMENLKPAEQSYRLGDTFFEDEHRKWVALEQELQANGYESLLCCTGYNLDIKKNYLNLILSKKVDSIILVGSNFIGSTEDENQYIKDVSTQVPIMLLNASFDYPNVYSTLCDDYGTMFEATAEMIQAGITDILYLYDSKSYSGLKKLHGFRDAMKEHNIPGFEKLIHFYDGNIEHLDEIADFVADIAKKGAPFHGIIKYAQKKGIRIPEDLSVMGYNNSMLTNCCTPELTSVDNRLETQTHQLVQTLLGVLAGEEMPKKSIFSGKIIKRGTTLF